MPRYHALIAFALIVLLSFPAVAAPVAAPDAPLFTRIVRFIKHLVPSTLDASDISFPRP